MLSLLNLILGQLVSGFVQWWLSAAHPPETPTLGPEDTARALAAIASILLLGLGAVLVISFSGSWVRRLIFPKPETPEPSFDSHFGTTEWARPNKEPNDQVGSGGPE